MLLVQRSTNGIIIPSSNSRLLESNKLPQTSSGGSGWRMFEEVWVGNQQPTGESFPCVNEGRQLVAGGISKPADLFEGWLG